MRTRDFQGVWSVSTSCRKWLVTGLSVDYAGLMRNLQVPLIHADLGRVLLDAAAEHYERQWPICSLVQLSVGEFAARTHHHRTARSDPRGGDHVERHSGHGADTGGIQDQAAALAYRAERSECDPVTRITRQVDLGMPAVTSLR
ncbi:hypothetical protein QRX60_44785 [Amycolatopsis mongoliensis]|uniref:Uncharacterized protein n=1 Tax=Amycolatopsis mongoliensis TaxID=715475 RepID=A0A9Y2NGR4_9PSEU|nr:hypothetical protein [Amycolatopsis sp. 4-36]WIY01079.1 hypothetical protein QRX60_44785 [Amycolatopsis sp. 4-36]